MLLINISGFVLIALIIWWFWLYRPQVSKPENSDLVVVVENGVYLPSNIVLEAGKPAEITFIRKDPSPCSETLLIPDLELSESLPLNQPIKIMIPELAAGKYPFHCQMQMYKGALEVKGPLTGMN